MTPRMEVGGGGGANEPAAGGGGVWGGRGGGGRGGGGGGGGGGGSLIQPRLDWACVVSRFEPKFGGKVADDTRPLGCVGYSHNVADGFTEMWWCRRPSYS